jgi:3-methyl-2-oxobutanoate hydroxymethyltransferase
MKITTLTLRKLKGQRPIVAATAYDAITARYAAEAGVFAVVAEMVEPNLARTIKETLKVPLIGSGSGADCDGQILVCTDVLGMIPESMPAFAQAFAAVGDEMKKGFAAYVTAVRACKFPK